LGPQEIKREVRKPRDSHKRGQAGRPNIVLCYQLERSLSGSGGTVDEAGRLAGGRRNRRRDVLRSTGSISRVQRAFVLSALLTGGDRKRRPVIPFCAKRPWFSGQKKNRNIPPPSAVDDSPKGTALFSPSKNATSRRRPAMGNIVAPAVSRGVPRAQTSFRAAHRKQRRRLGPCQRRFWGRPRLKSATRWLMARPGGGGDNVRGAASD